MSEQLKTDVAPSAPRATLLNLSLTQLVAGSMAAATAAALGSRLGVVGTITGAAIGSVVSAIASSVYATSMQRAHELLLTQKLHTRGSGPPHPSSVHFARNAPTRPPHPSSVHFARASRRALATATAIFALATAFLLGVQLASGTDVTGTSIGTRPPAARGQAPITTPESPPVTSRTATPGPSPTTPQPSPSAETFEPAAGAAATSEVTTAPEPTTPPEPEQSPTDTPPAGPTSQAS